MCILLGSPGQSQGHPTQSYLHCVVHSAVQRNKQSNNLYNAVQCSPMQCISAVQAVQCSAVQCSAVQSAVQAVWPIRQSS